MNNRSTNNTTNDTLQEPDNSWAIVGYIELVYFILGTPLNLMVAYICCHFIKGHKNQCIVLSMTMADTLFTILHCFVWYTQNTLRVQTAASCILMYYATYVGSIASSLNLLLLNIDKFILVNKPLHYNIIITRSRLLTAITMTWIVSLCWSSLILWGPATRYKPPCSFESTGVRVYLTFVVIFYTLPICMSLATSFYIAGVVIKTQRRNESRKQRQNEGSGLGRLSKSGDSVIATASPTMSLSNQPGRHSGEHNLMIASRSPTASSLLGENLVTKTKYLRRRKNVTGRASLRPSSSTRGIRSILFVFCSTIWTSFTSLPYRIVFVIYKTQADTSFLPMYTPHVTFALMALNPIGNSLITILTQRRYVTFIKQMFKSSKNSTSTAGNNGSAIMASVSGQPAGGRHALRSYYDHRDSLSLPITGIGGIRAAPNGRDRTYTSGSGGSSPAIPIVQIDQVPSLSDNEVHYHANTQLDHTRSHNNIKMTTIKHLLSKNCVRQDDDILWRETVA